MDSAAADEARALVETAGVKALDDLVVLRATGDDVRSWLNGQVTQDVRTTEPGQATYALVVTVKGRIITDVWAHDDRQSSSDKDSFSLVVPRIALEPLSAQLDKMIIMEDVELERADARVLTVQGPRAVEVIETGLEAASREGVWTCDRLGAGGRDVVVGTDAVESTLERLVAAAKRIGGFAVSDEGWELARLRRAVPKLGPDFGDRTYPQETGLDARAVSFTKGCYIGQEVVCMLEARGQVTRRLVQLRVEGASAPPQGVKIHADDDEGAEVGSITSSALDPESNDAVALAYVKRKLAERGQRVRVEAAGAIIESIVGA